MNVQELVNYCNERGIPLDTQIAMRAKDDYFLAENCIQLGIPYFGNSGEGEKWMEENGARDADGYVDYENTPKFLLLDTDWS
jgi:hypothetical protein